MAKIIFTLRDGSGNALSGWTAQVRNSGNSIVASTSDSSITDYGNGSYVTTSDFESGEYAVWATKPGGTIQPVLGYSPLVHVAFPLAASVGGTGETEVLGDIIYENSPLSIDRGGTGLSVGSLSALHQGLSLEPGVDIQAHSATLDSISTGNSGVTAKIPLWDGATTSWMDEADVKSAMNIGTISVQNDPLPTLHGGTGAATNDMAQLRAHLGVEIGADVQAHNAKLDTVAGISGATTKTLVYDGASLSWKNVADTKTALSIGAVAAENVLPLSLGGTGGTSAATGRSGLGLGTVATESVIPLSMGGTGVAAASVAAAQTALEVKPGTHTQAYSADLSAVDAKLALASGDMFLGTSSGVIDTFSMTGARTALGLGAVYNEDVVPIAKGGTAGTTAAAARTGLGLGTVATYNVTGTAEAGKVPSYVDDGSGKCSLAIPVFTKDTGITANADNVGKIYFRQTGSPASSGTFGLYTITINGAAGGYPTYIERNLFLYTW